MNIHDATEQAYKNGYNDGVRDIVKKLECEAYTTSPVVVDMTDVNRIAKELTKR